MYDRKSSLALASAISLILLLLPSASAAPSLAVGSRAGYNLTAYFQAQQSCTAEPSQYTPQACGFGPPPPPPQRTEFVSIFDNRTCEVSSFSCGFSPRDLTVEVGIRVVWTNNGQLLHTVTSDSPTGPLNSPPLGPGQTYEFVPVASGNNIYHCNFHPWLMGSVNAFSVPQPPPPPPPPSSVRVNFDGTVAWETVGLDNNVAVLNVAHQVMVSFSPAPGVTVTPLTESGSFEQVVDLNTRALSSGTATSIVKELLRSLSRTLPGYYYGYSPAAVAVSPLVAAGMLNTDHHTHYTDWWVNGPLNNGSPIQILIGHGSVTGQETLNLGSLGTRAAWIVTSKLSQSISLTDPYAGSSTVDASFDLLWSYDKKGDLLLRDNATINLLVRSENRQSIIVSNPCAPYGWCPVYAEVMVIREVKVTITLAMKLASTNINLDARMRRPGQTSLIETMASLPWLPMGLAGAAVGTLAGAGAWIMRRNHKNGQIPQVPPLQQQT